MALDRVLHFGQRPRTVAEVLAARRFDPRCPGCLCFRRPSHCTEFDGLPLKDASACPGRQPILWDDAPRNGRNG